jgi:hypothetical protein
MNKRNPSLSRKIVFLSNFVEIKDKFGKNINLFRKIKTSRKELTATFQLEQRINVDKRKISINILEVKRIQ